MCGRFYLKLEKLYAEYLEVEQNGWPGEFEFYNISPTQDAPVVRAHEGHREGRILRWGLVPFWAKGVPPKYSTINATVEKIEAGPTWRGPWKRGQRCIIPATGFYEWYTPPSGPKEPYAITLADQPLVPFAGLWDRSVADDGTAIESFTIVTLPANPLMARIHNLKKRMPAILHEMDFEAWLTGTAEEAKAVIEQYPDSKMKAWRVSARVNSPRNQGEGLIEPVASA